MKKEKKRAPISKKSIHQAVADSSALEGLSFEEAKKDKEVIALLKKHGRAFSLT